MAIDLRFLKKLTSKTRDVYKKNWQSYKAAKVESENLQNEEKRLSEFEAEVLLKQENLKKLTGLDLTDYVQAMASGLNLNQYIKNEEISGVDEAEVVGQVRAILAEKKQLETKRGELAERKSHLIKKLDELEETAKLLRDEEADIQRQADEIRVLKQQVEEEEDQVAYASKTLLPIKSIKVNLSGFNKVSFVLVIIITLICFMFAGLIGWVLYENLKLEKKYGDTNSELDKAKGIIQKQAATINEKDKQLNIQQLALSRYTNDLGNSCQQETTLREQNTNLKNSLDEAQRDLAFEQERATHLQNTLNAIRLASSQIRCRVSTDCGNSWEERVCKEKQSIALRHTFLCVKPNTVESECISKTITVSNIQCEYNEYCSGGSCIKKGP